MRWGRYQEALCLILPDDQAMIYLSQHFLIIPTGFQPNPPASSTEVATDMPTAVPLAPPPLALTGSAGLPPAWPALGQQQYDADHPRPLTLAEGGQSVSHLVDAQPGAQAAGAAGAAAGAGAASQGGAGAPDITFMMPEAALPVSNPYIDVSLGGEVHRVIGRRSAAETHATTTARANTPTTTNSACRPTRPRAASALRPAPAQSRAAGRRRVPSSFPRRPSAFRPSGPTTRTCRRSGGWPGTTRRRGRRSGSESYQSVGLQHLLH